MAVTLFHKVINYNNKVKVTIKNKAPEPPKQSNLGMTIRMRTTKSREVEKK